MKIPEWLSISEQVCNIGCHQWSVARLIQLSKDFPIMDVPLDHLNTWYKYENLTLREMVMHIKAVQDSDLDFPIILDEDNNVMDGRHRLMKAILLGKETIKVVRFEENPRPCNETS